MKMLMMAMTMYAARSFAHSAHSSTTPHQQRDHHPEKHPLPSSLVPFDRDD